MTGLTFSREQKWWFLGVADTNDVIQKIEKTLNNTHTTTQKLTNNSFRNTKKHPQKCNEASLGVYVLRIRPKNFVLVVVLESNK